MIAAKGFQTEKAPRRDQHGVVLAFLRVVKKESNMDVILFGTLTWYVTTSSRWLPSLLLHHPTLSSSTSGSLGDSKHRISEQQQQLPFLQANHSSKITASLPPGVFLIGVLSLNLLALSILEATPSGWLLFLKNDAKDSQDLFGQNQEEKPEGVAIQELSREYHNIPWKLSITRAYQLVLFALASIILIAVPCWMGSLCLRQYCSFLRSLLPCRTRNSADNSKQQ